eukprot:TRINITY_DN2006_c0_g3_i4.p1 TRINITY_DN2006_c0_g3~~TRINITY_DN2006_c0_g3_i4.p1  ORF type:complete len:466 (+),score=140.25 TRINITY_DN2006_c0_g3_i4:123-1520(+)
MDSVPKCEEHGKPLQMICTSCNTLLCLSCLSQHAKGECKWPMGIPTYASEQLVEKYQSCLKALEEQKDLVGSSMGKLRESFVELKDSLNQFVSSIESGIKQLDYCVAQMDSLEESIRESLANECEDVKEAAKCDDLSYLVSKINTKELNYILDMKASKDKLSGAIKEIAKQLSIRQSIDDAKNTVKLLNEVHQNFIVHRPKSLEAAVYGVCNPEGDCKRLCKYDVKAAKLSSLIKVPRFCTVTQMSNAVFVSGGGSPTSSAVSEFFERNVSLVTKKPMKYAKYRHKTEVLSRNTFMAIGGFDGKVSIARCEEYSVAEDRWTEAPALNKARYHTATALLNGLLYAIGGFDAQNDVEVLDLSQKSVWTCVKVAKSEVSIGNSAAAFPISDTEIMILCGDFSTAAGLYDLQKESIKKHQLALGKDYYCFNSVCKIGDSMYIIGMNGHIHIYRTKSGEFEEIDYSVASS